MIKACDCTTELLKFSSAVSSEVKTCTSIYLIQGASFEPKDKEHKRAKLKKKIIRCQNE